MSSSSIVLIIAILVVLFIIWIVYPLPAPIAAQDAEPVTSCVVDFEWIGVHQNEDALEFLRQWEAVPSNYDDAGELALTAYARGKITDGVDWESGVIIYHKVSDPGVFYLLVFENLTPNAKNYDGDVHPCRAYLVDRQDVEKFLGYLRNDTITR